MAFPRAFLLLCNPSRKLLPPLPPLRCPSVFRFENQLLFDRRLFGVVGVESVASMSAEASTCCVALGAVLGAADAVDTPSLLPTAAVGSSTVPSSAEPFSKTPARNMALNSARSISPSPFASIFCIIEAKDASSPTLIFWTYAAISDALILPLPSVSTVSKTAKRPSSDLSMSAKMVVLCSAPIVAPRSSACDPSFSETGTSFFN